MNKKEDEITQEDTIPVYHKDNTLLVIIVTVAILIAGLGGYQYLEANKVEAKKSDVENFLPTVEVVSARRLAFVPTIELQGEVMPATETELISEVAGAIIEVSPKLEVGSVIDENEIILRVNDADYLTQLANAESSLADAELMLAQEKARAEQSIRDWKKLGRGKEASELVRRLPQIKSAEARITAAKAAIAKADRDVAKTVIRAPYRCIVDQKFIDDGAYLSAMSRIAKIYSVSRFEVRLPVSLDKVNFLPADNGVGHKVKLIANIGGEKLQWDGVVNRFEGGIDSKTFSMMMVVGIAPNPKQGLFQFPPKGLFIDGQIQGKNLSDVIQIPRVAMRENQTIWILDDDRKLRMKKVITVREERDHIYIESDLKDGSNIIISPIATPIEGMQLEQQEKLKPKDQTNG